jgi:hypothetical protein
MGPDDDPRAVVDENGKVRRVDGLYAGDASIMPDTPSVATNPTTILMAEIVADRIKATRAKTGGAYQWTGMIPLGRLWCWCIWSRARPRITPRHRPAARSRSPAPAPARAVPARMKPSRPQDQSTHTSKEAAMRAITVSNYGASLSVTELPTPQAGPGQVLIATQAAGMNPMDMQIASGGWQDLMSAKFPMVLGADLAGTVREDGPGAARFAPGDEVFGQMLVPPLDLPGHTRSTWPAARMPR